MTKIAVDKALIEQAIEALDVLTSHSKRHRPNAMDAGISAYHALRTALAEPAVESIGGWQPIETAPRDGSLIVVKGFNYGDESLGCHHCIACWHVGAWMEASDWNATSELKYLVHWAPLLTDGAVPQAQPAVEPVVCTNKQAMEVRNSIGLMKNEDERNNYGNHATAIKVLEAFLASPPPPAEVPLLTDAQLDTVRQWFNCVQDTNVEYLEQHDYALAKEIYERLGRRVPISIEQAVRQNAGLK